MTDRAGAKPELSLPLEELVSHYKSRVEDFEKERQHLLEVLDRTSEDGKALYRIRWENRKRLDEIRELQKALSDAHTYLFEERERLLNLKTENEELRLQEAEDRRRIASLLSLTQPTEHEVVLGGGRAAQGVANHHIGGGGDRKASHGQAGPSAPPVLRSVVYPSEGVEALSLRVRALQARLEEQKLFSEERIAALLEDRRIREMDHAAQMSAALSLSDELTEKLKRSQSILELTTRDVLEAKRERDAARTAAAEAAAGAAAEGQRRAAEVEALREEAERALEAARRDAESDMAREVGTLRSQLKAREKEIRQLQGLSEAVRQGLEGRVRQLEDEIGRHRERARHSEARRAMESEGFLADITLLRKRIANLERRLLQIRLSERLEDDERLDRLLSDIEGQIQRDSGPAVNHKPRAARARALRPGSARAAHAASSLAIVRAPQGGGALAAAGGGSGSGSEARPNPSPSLLRLVDAEGAAARPTAAEALGGVPERDLLEEIGRVRALLNGLEVKLQAKAGAGGGQGGLEAYA